MSHLRHIRVVFLQFHADPVISCCSGVLQRVLKIRAVCLASHQIREGYVVAFVLFMRCQYRRIDKCHVLLLLSQVSACVVFRFPDNVCSPRCLPPAAALRNDHSLPVTPAMPSQWPGSAVSFWKLHPEALRFLYFPCFLPYGRSRGS